MDYRRNLPFYMGYPQYQNWNQIDEDMLLEDLEYLQQMYPMYAKRYQVIINEFLDKMDYDGSMIYDQYPDRWQLERMVRNILNSIQLEQAIPSMPSAPSTSGDMESPSQMPGLNGNMNPDMNPIPTPYQNPDINNGLRPNDSNLPWIKELITVLLYYEILKRRKKRRDYRYF